MTSPVLHIKGEILIGPQESLPELWVIDGRITFTAPMSGDVQTVRGFVLPGLVDAHAHVGLERHGAVTDERAIEHAITQRETGVLLVRDAGSPKDTRFIQERDDLPELIRAGRHIARTKRYLRNYGHEIEPDELPEYVRLEARRADGWVKVVGDWIDRDAGDLTPCWPVEALSAAIEVAHAEGARVTAHCFGEQVLHDVAAAGVDCVEHATGLTEATIAQFAEQQIAIVPTLVNIANFPAFAAAGEAKFPAYAAHMRDLHARRFETVGKAREAGVPIFVGTDAGGHLPHGLAAHEIEALTRTGMSSMEALSAATWSAREWLRRPGIAEGESADLVVYSQDPRIDVRVVADPKHIILRGTPVPPRQFG